MSKLSVDFTGLQEAVDKACKTIDTLREEKQEAIRLLARCFSWGKRLPEDLELEVAKFLKRMEKP